MDVIQRQLMPAIGNALQLNLSVRLLQPQRYVCGAGCPEAKVRLIIWGIWAVRATGIVQAIRAALGSESEAMVPLHAAIAAADLTVARRVAVCGSSFRRPHCSRRLD